MSTSLRYFLPLGAAITILSFMIFVVAQQQLRQAANDPQILIAEDLANRFSKGEPLPSSGFTETVDIAKQLDIFLILFDEKGNIIASQGKLNGKDPELPKGVLDHAKKTGKNIVTWQPQKRVRLATVVIPYNGTDKGFILVGKSLREVEKRIQLLQIHVLIGYLITLIVTFLLVHLLIPKPTKKK